MKKFALACALLSIGLSSYAQGKPKTIKVGVAIYDNSDTFMSTVVMAMRNYEKNSKGAMRLTFADGQRQQTLQDDQINTFISQKMDVVCINLVDRTAAGPIIDKLKTANIPVVFFNRQPTETDMAKWDNVYYVGTKSEDAGTIQAQMFYDEWTKNPALDKNKDGKLQYVILTGEPGHQDAIARTQAVKDFFKGKGLGADVLGEDTAMWQVIEGQNKMNAFLAKSGDSIEAVLANNDDMALGAIQAIKATKFKIPVLGIDATAPAKDAVAQGAMMGTVVNDALNQGQDTLKIAMNVKSGKSPGDGVPTLKGKIDMVPYRPYKK